MSELEDQTVLITGLINRFRNGDEAARDELLAGVYDRLVRLSRKMLRGSSPAVRRWEETEDVLHRAWFRLQRTLATDEVVIHDSTHFFRLAARSLRFELIDLYRQYTGAQGLAANHHTQPRGGVGEGSLGADRLHPVDATGDPGRLSEWAEFHRAVEELPEQEREIFDLVWYHSMKQEEAAGLLAVDVRTIKRRWRNARLLLSEKLKGELPPL